MASLSAAIRRTLGVHCESYFALLLPLLILQSQLHHGSSQQTYLKDYQSDCFNNHTNVLGYSCAAEPLPSCTAYLTFRANSTYSNVNSIAFLLSANDSAIAQANNVTDVAEFPDGHLLYVPVNCSCATVNTGKRYYQHNASYAIKVKGETYETITNQVYEMLTSCQATIAQNSYSPTNLSVGDVVTAPLMCVCPSANQTANGIKYIVSYLVRTGDTLTSIASLFGVDLQLILDANELDLTSTIYALYPILIPLKTTPEKINLNPSEAQSPSPPPPPPPPPPPSSGSSKKWIFVGVGIGAAVVALPVLFLIVFLICRRKRRQHQPPPSPASPPKKRSPPATITTDETGSKGKEWNSNSWSVSSDGIRYAIESLSVYKFEALQKATDDFGESNRINGSVFRGEFNGDPAAVKVLNGDVSAEINILKQINHSNIIRLSGFCVHNGNTYLVYEFAEKGSLRDLLVESKDTRSYSSPLLEWKHRVQIAYGIAEGLNYLHNYCNPPYVHKNLSSSNVLVDGNLRAKITNFGLARTVAEEDGDGGGGMHLTKHVVGTKGYIAPEYIENGLVTPKMDVYAFGVVVLELLSGRAASAKGGGGYEDEEMPINAASITEVLEGENVREKLRRFIDGRLSNRYPFDLAYSMAQLAKMCVAPDLNSRLSISEVLGLLSKIHSSSLDWDPSDELDRSSSLTHASEEARNQEIEEIVTDLERRCLKYSRSKTFRPTSGHDLMTSEERTTSSICIMDGGLLSTLGSFAPG